jgi:O-acetyl-ADP-ribose deacetylase (regulator of RNase III)
LITEGYNLPAKNIIHVVGPVINGKVGAKQKQELADCYINSLNLCKEKNLKSIAFCCISTGVFHFPNNIAAEIAVETVTNWLASNNHQMERIIFNVFKDEDRLLYEKLLS